MIATKNATVKVTQAQQCPCLMEDDEGAVWLVYAISGASCSATRVHCGGVAQISVGRHACALPVHRLKPFKGTITLEED